MALIGALALALALGAALLTVFAGFTAGRTRVQRYAVISENGLYALFALIAVAAATLLWAFIHHDFSLKYVGGRSDTRMPLHYVLAAFYGGQEGSLLFWVLVSSGFGAAAAWANRFRMPAVMPYFHAVIALALTGFLAILNFVTNPFASYIIANAPTEGDGLNPLLQTPLMTIHPPMLLAGFATAVVPFAFGMAALLARQTDSSWLRATRRWTLASWLILGIGNILGGMWAYRELGWGGYWAWDAVENAALVPWFVATAFVHSVIIQEQRGLLKRWNVFLVTLYYLLTLLGTWMTRSGLIDSVHTFAESDVGVYFLMQLLAMTGFSLFVIAIRWKDLKPEADMEDALSREGMFVFNNWLFLGMAGVVLYGTLFPKFAEMAVQQTITYGAPWFNRVMTPLALLMLLVMALGTVMPWRRATWKSARTQIVPPVGLTLLTTPLLIAAYWFGRGRDLGLSMTNFHAIIAALTFALIVLNGWILFFEFARGTKSRLSKEASAVAAFTSLFAKQRRRYGGYLAHIGVLMIFLSFIGNVLKVEREVTLRAGDEVPVADYVIRFDGMSDQTNRDYIAFVGNMTLLKDGKEITTLQPARYDYNDYTRIARGGGDPMKVTSEIYIRSTLLEDVYVAMLNFDREGRTAAFKLEVFPFTVWMWLGGLMLIFGTAIAAWPEIDPLREAWRRDVARRSAELASSVALFLICLVPIGVMTDTTFSVARAQEANVDSHVHADGEVHVLSPQAPKQNMPADLGQFLGQDVPLTPHQHQIANETFSMVMTTCEGCAGKTLTLASPACVPSNIDKQQIRMMVAQGMTQDQILDSIADERGGNAVAIPRDPGMRALSWLLPTAMLGGGLFVAVMFLSARRKKTSSTIVDGQPDALDELEANYLAQLEREMKEQAR